MGVVGDGHGVEQWSARNESRRWQLPCDGWSLFDRSDLAGDQWSNGRRHGYYVVLLCGGPGK